MAASIASKQVVNMANMAEESEATKIARASNGPERFVALDGIRGITAIMIILCHIPAWNPVFDIMLIKHTTILVDLFFVLSGFVIYQSYGQGLSNLQQVRRFLWLRLARLYPVHFLFLIVFLLIELVKYYAALKFGMKAANSSPFVENNAVAFIEQLFLVQAFGSTQDALSFNFPAWTISVEFFSYLLFTATMLWVRKFKAVVFVLLALAAGYLLVTQDRFGISCVLRGMTGFFVGCLTVMVVNSAKTVKVLPAFWVTVFTSAILFYLQFIPDPSFDILIYPLSALLIWAIARSGTGLVKRVFCHKISVFLGMISYSLYMAHAAVIWTANAVVRLMYPATSTMIEGKNVTQLPLGPALIALAITMTLVILVSMLTYYGVEQPLRDRSRKMFQVR